ncbi:MAG: class IIb bacteriocin, lactobin A/cerein 7B family [Draconibacterium sp.]|nr:class IIb bacteriocin, lactobin A/cerein 7B family [Draconibacterium sp.]
MDNLIELKEKELKEIDGGKKEWILLGCLISPVAACFAIGFYLEYNTD